MFKCPAAQILSAEGQKQAAILAYQKGDIDYPPQASDFAQIEGRIVELLLGSGWTLEIERPAILSLSGNSPVVVVDGDLVAPGPVGRR